MSIINDPDKRASIVYGALWDLRTIRSKLLAVGAVKSADKVRKAIKSVEGAVRHAENLQTRALSNRPWDEDREIAQRALKRITKLQETGK